MADGTRIEWTDATSERGRSLGRNDRDIRKLNAPDKPICRGPALLLEPRPYISVTLAAVAAKAGWDDVRMLGHAPMTNGDDVIPRLGRLVAVGTQALELLQDERPCARRDHFNTSVAQRCTRPASLAKFDAFRVSVAHFCVCAGLAHSLFCHLTQGKPFLASTTPRLATLARPLPVRLRRSWRRSHVPARAADIGVAVEPRSIFSELGQWLRISAAAAFLCAIHPARDKPSVCCTTIFGGSHAF